jgi:S-DNA-T family DNA segregation ATPase FtsK/SpoIIIE
VGLLLAVLLGASLVSYYPGDQSLFHHSTEVTPLRNWVGPVGAELAALCISVLGLSALLLPIFLLVFGWRRFRAWGRVRVFGRGLGVFLLLLAFPGLLQLTVETVVWRGFPVPSGGGVGELVSESLRRALGSAGTLAVLVGAVMAGSALVVQSSLGEILASWGRRLRRLFDGLGYAWSRRRQRRVKERSRQRVIAKHLSRAKEERSSLVSGGEAMADKVDLPLRVTKKTGEGGFRVRKVIPEPESRGEPKPKRRPQKRLAFQHDGSAVAQALPPVNLLRVEGIESAIEEDELVRMGELIRSRCGEFGVEGTIEAITPGPVITVYEFQPAPGVKVSQIINLQDDLALALKAESVRIERLPGRSTLGIEVPSRDRAVIRLGYLLDQESFRKAPSVLTMAMGTTIHGEPYYADLAVMPHVLVAGATGSGKSVGLQSMITSVVYKARWDQVQFIFIDPKRIELGAYKDIPYLKTEVVVEPKKAANALRWAVAEMERRYRLLAEVHVRSIEFYNQAISDPRVRERLMLSEGGSDTDSSDLKPLPYYVIVIDELADLMVLASGEVEAAIARLAQMARAVGIHLIVSTQRPSVDVLTGTIKANFPCRVAYATATRHDSRTILDQIGAEKLLGNGDMLFMPPGSSRLIRLHGGYVSEQETAALVRWLKKQARPQLDPAVLQAPPEEERGGAAGGSDGDELFDEAVRLVVAEQQASASFLQRRLRVGFSRAARLIDLMERDGLLGPPQGSKPREVLVKPDYFEEFDRARQQTEI